MPTRTTPIAAALLALTATFALRTHADDRPARVDAKTALGWFNPLVGEWRGVGQVRRGSRVGAWRETGEFLWDFTKDEPAVRYVVTDGKHLKSARITYAPRTTDFTIAAVLADGTKRTYVGRPEDGNLVADAAADDDGNVHRLVITPLNDKRTLVRYETRKATAKFFVRLGEVGCTRAGTRLAVAGATEPECIVTGGRGTSLVSFEGKSYYVCCTGCRQAFEDDPKGVIAQYEAKLAARREGE